MPKPPKLLPKPCPKCSSKYGTSQIILFNPKFHHDQRYHRRPPNVLVRIEHPGPRLPSKPRCTFRVRKGYKIKNIPLEEIFNHRDEKVITIPIKERLYDSIKKYDWGIIPSTRKKKPKAAELISRSKGKTC